MDGSRDLACSSHDGRRESFQVLPMFPRGGGCAGGSARRPYAISFRSTPVSQILLLVEVVIVIGDFAMVVVAACERARVVMLRTTLSGETSTVLVRAIAVWRVVVVVVVMVAIQWDTVVLSPIMVTPGALNFVKVLLLIVRMNDHTCSNLAQPNYFKLLLLQATFHDLASELAAELGHHIRAMFRRIGTRGPVIVRAHTNICAATATAAASATERIFTALHAMTFSSSTSCATV